MASLEFSALAKSALCGISANFIGQCPKPESAHLIPHPLNFQPAAVFRQPVLLCGVCWWSNPILKSESIS